MSKRVLIIILIFTFTVLGAQEKEKTSYTDLIKVADYDLTTEEFEEDDRCLGDISLHKTYCGYMLEIGSENVGGGFQMKCLKEDHTVIKTIRKTCKQFVIRLNAPLSVACEGDISFSKMMRGQYLIYVQSTAGRMYDVQMFTMPQLEEIQTIRNTCNEYYAELENMEPK